MNDAFVSVCSPDRVLIEQWCVDGDFVLAAFFVVFVIGVIAWVVKESSE